jgi:methylated-DNA-[protein]-cysteine S-methyltransferase
MTASGHVYAVDGWGVGEVWVEHSRVVAHDLPSQSRVPPRAQGGQGDPNTAAPLGGARLPLGTVAADPSRERDDFVSELCRRFAHHLAGDVVVYDDIELDNTWCTPFQRALLEALRSIPWGEIVAYGELAALAGRPAAARAAGAFCAGNRFALIVPCHRVVGATSIGGYGDAGIVTKRDLLRLEGIEL